MSHTVFYITTSAELSFFSSIRITGKKISRGHVAGDPAFDVLSLISYGGNQVSINLISGQLNQRSLLSIKLQSVIALENAVSRLTQSLPFRPRDTAATWDDARPSVCIPGAAYFSPAAWHLSFGIRRSFHAENRSNRSALGESPYIFHCIEDLGVQV